MSRNHKTIKAKPEFRSLGQHSIHAELQQGKRSPISREVERLMTEYIDVLQKVDKTPITEEDIQNLVPNCCYPIEAIALRFAADLVGTKEVLTVLRSLAPELHIK